MASVIKKYQWDLSRDRLKAISAPSATLLPGHYDIEVTVTLTDGTVKTIVGIVAGTPDEKVRVGEDNQNLLNNGGLTDKSFFFGVKPSVSSGWSESTGSAWIWPESSAAVSIRMMNGRSYLTAWDKTDDKEYWLNTGFVNGHETSYLDKGTTDIVCSVILRELVAASRTDIIKHLDTVVFYTTDIDSGSLAAGIEFDLGLITTAKEDPIETINGIQSGIDYTFKEDSLQRDGENIIQQLKISVNKSEFLITEIESMFRRIDKSRTASADSTVVFSASDVEFNIASNISNWITTPNYEVDLGNGNAISYGSLTPVRFGSDGLDTDLPTTMYYASTGLTSTLTLENDAIVSGTVMVLYESSTTIPVFSPSITLSDYGSVFEFGGTKEMQFAYYTGAIGENLELVGSANQFDFCDFRVLTTALSTSEIDIYLADIRRFIPGV